MKKTKLKDKVAIITGSSMGIGKAIAMELASRGAIVVLNGRELPKLYHAEQELLAMGAQVLAVPADVRYVKDCENLIEQTLTAFGKIDILVNNAAITTRGSVEEMDPIIFSMVMDTNFRGSVYPTKIALPHLKRTKGHIIFINSVAGFRGLPYNSIYSCSKMAQSGLAEAMRVELHDYGIHVGIAWVSFTQNDPQKKILDTDGRSWINLPKRQNVALDSPQMVARNIRRMITYRQAKINYSVLGKITKWMQGLFPGLIDLIFLRNRERIRDQFTFIGGEPVPQESFGKSISME